jgi:hypothetical protein
MTSAVVGSKGLHRGRAGLAVDGGDLAQQRAGAADRQYDLRAGGGAAGRLDPAGPATRPLPPATVTLKDGNVTIG